MTVLVLKASQKLRSQLETGSTLTRVWKWSAKLAKRASPYRYGRQIPFAYLINIKDDFLDKFASRAKGATENGLDKTFG